MAVWGDEELAAIGATTGEAIDPAIGHRKDPRSIVPEVRVDLVVEVVSRSPGSSSEWAASLDHEVCDDAVELEAVVVIAGGEVEEIGCGDRGSGGEDGGFNVTLGGLDRDLDIMDRFALGDTFGGDEEWNDDSCQEGECGFHSQIVFGCGFC